MTLTVAPSQSVAAYFELEATASNRHEYYVGELLPMAGGTPNHNQIISNLNAMMNFGLRRQPYRTYASDQRLWMPEVAVGAYPDFMVVAEPLEFYEERQDTLMNALLIAEVLSKSTRNYDRGDKFAAYRTLPQLQEYLTLEQTIPYVEHHIKTEEGWLLKEYGGLDTEVTLRSLPIVLSLADLYDKVDGTNAG